LSIAAIEDARPLGVLRGAIAHAGLARGALDQAERDGLIAVADAGARFRHPLVRAAVLELATESERGAAHEALADALADAGAEDRSTWHRSRAAVAPDATVAAALAAAGRRAQARGDHGSAATALERAAELAGEPAQAVSWAAAAAREAWEAGDPHRARRLVARTLPLCRGGDRARLLALRGVIEARTGDVRAAAEILLEATEYSDSPSLTLGRAHRDARRHARRRSAPGLARCQIARDRALLSILPAALQEQSTAMLGRGRFVLAHATAEEAAGLTRDLGQRWGELEPARRAVVDPRRRGGGGAIGPPRRGRGRARASRRLGPAGAVPGAAFDARPLPWSGRDRRCTGSVRGGGGRSRLAIGVPARPH
jgi:tetratricopeptide (TPR) repeat protein